MFRDKLQICCFCSPWKKLKFLKSPYDTFWCDGLKQRMVWHFPCNYFRDDDSKRIDVSFLSSIDSSSVSVWFL